MDNVKSHQERISLEGIGCADTVINIVANSISITVANAIAWLGTHIPHKATNLNICSSYGSHKHSITASTVATLVQRHQGIGSIIVLITPVGTIVDISCHASGRKKRLVLLYFRRCWQPKSRKSDGIGKVVGTESTVVACQVIIDMFGKDVIVVVCDGDGRCPKPFQATAFYCPFRPPTWREGVELGKEIRRKLSEMRKVATTLLKNDASRFAIAGVRRNATHVAIVLDLGRGTE